MGTWGTKLYQDDVTSDVRSYYQKAIKKTKNGALATDELLKAFSSELDDHDDAPLVWFALADTQWDYGRLEGFVKEKALYYLEEGTDLSRWNNESPKDLEKRKGVLDKLKEKLLSPQPPEKKIAETKHYRCQWKIGDVYAYPLVSDYAKEKGLEGRYFLFHKIDECTWYPGNILPIVRVKMTKDSELPLDEKAFDALDYIQTGNRMDDGNNESKTGLYYDEYGFLPIYRLRLYNTSKRAIPKNLIYLGNFQHVAAPLNENFPRCDVGMPCSLWKWFDEYMINRYFNFNLRQAPIYAKKKDD